MYIITMDFRRIGGNFIGKDKGIFRIKTYRVLYG